MRDLWLLLFVVFVFNSGVYFFAFGLPALGGLNNPIILLISCFFVFIFVWLFLRKVEKTGFSPNLSEELDHFRNSHVGAKHVAIFPVKTGAIFLAKIGKKEWVPKMFQIAEWFDRESREAAKAGYASWQIDRNIAVQKCSYRLLRFGKDSVWYKDMLRLVNFYHSVDHSDAVKFIRENPDYLKGHSRDGIK